MIRDAAITSFAGLSLASLLAISPDALAASHQVYVGGHLTVSLDPGPRPARRRFGCGMSTWWQATISPSAQPFSPEMGVFTTAQWAPGGWRFAGGWRGGVMWLPWLPDRVDRIVLSGHTGAFSVDGDLGVAVHTHDGAGLHLGIGALGVAGELRFQAAIRGGPANPALVVGAALPVGPRSDAIVGRPIRIAGAPRWAPLVGGPGPDERWFRDARTEHASIAAFVHLARSLRALGAPSDLERRALAAAADEALHTAICLRQARRRAAGPLPIPATMPLPPLPRDRRTLLEETAHDSWRDGVIGEGNAATTAAREADTSHDADDRRALRRIADDEARHAQLGADVLAWCRRAGARFRPYGSPTA